MNKNIIYLMDKIKDLQDHHKRLQDQVIDLYKIVENLKPKKSDNSRKTQSANYPLLKHNHKPDSTIKCKGCQDLYNSYSANIG